MQRTAPRLHTDMLHGTLGAVAFDYVHFRHDSLYANVVISHLMDYPAFGSPLFSALCRRMGEDLHLLADTATSGKTVCCAELL